MKNSNHSAIRYQFLLVLLFLVQFAQANPPGFGDGGDDVEDVAPAPIDDWILPMAIIGIVVMYYFIKKKRQSLV
jgi:hypothetical protein